MIADNKFTEPVGTMKNANKLQFVVAYSLNKKHQLSFHGFDSLEKIKSRIDGHNNILQWLRGSTRLLYFDIDKIEWNRVKFKNAMDQFIRLINTILKTPDKLKREHFQFHTKCNSDGNVISIHIISNCFSMVLKEMKALAFEICKTITIDLSIYSKGRGFYLCYNGKVGKQCFEYDTINDNEYELLWIDLVSDRNELLTYDIPKPESDYCNGIETLLQNKKILKNTTHWISIMKFVKENQVMSRENFCKNTLVANYTYEENCEMWDECEMINIDKSIENLYFNITHRRLVNTIFCSYFWSKVKHHLKQVPSKEMKEHFINTEISNKESNRKKKTVSYENVKYNFPTSILTINGFSYFYLFDKQYKPENMQFTVMSPKQVSKTVIKNNKKGLFINGKWGCGKTHFIITPLVDEARELNRTVLVVTTINSLNTQYTTDLQLVGHLQNVDEDYAVTSLESLYKYNKQYDYLILDEFVSIMSHFNSSTMTNKRKTNDRDAYQKLVRMCKTAKKVVVCDADLTRNTYSEFLEYIDPDPEIIHMKTNKYDDCVFNYYLDKKIFQHLITKSLENKERIVIATNTASSTISFLRRLNCIQGLNILGITKNETNLLGKVVTNREATDIKADLKKCIEKNNIHVFVYSPTISIGVSYNEEWFDRQFGYWKWSNNTPNARVFLQMLFRVRKIKSRNYHICVEGHGNPVNDKTSEDLLSTLEVSKDFFRREFNEIRIIENVSFTNIILESEAETMNSIRSFSYSFYRLLKRHNLNIKIITELDEDIFDLNLKDESKVQIFFGMKIPTLVEIKELLIKQYVFDEKLETPEIIIIDFCKILLRREFIIEPENTLSPITYNFYGVYPYEILCGKKEQWGTAEEMQKICTTRQWRNNICKRRFNTYDINLTQVSEREVNEKVRLEKINILYDHLEKSLFNKKEIQFSKEQIQYINQLKSDRSNVTYTEKNIGHAIKYILNPLFNTQYGYNFIQDNTMKRGYKKIPNSLLNIDNYVNKNSEERFNGIVNVKQTRKIQQLFKVKRKYKINPSKKVILLMTNEYPQPKDFHWAGYNISDNVIIKDNTIEKAKYIIAHFLCKYSKNDVLEKIKKIKKYISPMVTDLRLKKSLASSRRLLIHQARIMVPRLKLV